MAVPPDDLSNVGMIALTELPVDGTPSSADVLKCAPAFAR
jgi:hypothetical protein